MVRPYDITEEILVYAHNVIDLAFEFGDHLPI